MKTTHKFVMTDDYIKEAQRRSIAQNKTLKFFYQTWWAWWLPRIAMVVIMIVAYLLNLGSTVALFAVLFVISFTGEWLGKWNLAKVRKRVRTKGTTSTVQLNDQGVDIEGVNGNSHLKWSAMLRPAIYPDGVLIKFSRIAMVWLPDDALIDGSSEDVRRLLAKNVPDSSGIHS